MKVIRISLVLIVLLYISGGVFAQKTDTLYLVNGDRVIGEVKSLRYGILKYSTSSMGTVKIEWEDVVRLHSDKRFEIHLDNTQVIFGYIDSTHVTSPMLDLFPDLQDQLELIDIVEIIPIRQLFWKRFDGGIDFGYSFTKASNIGQLSVTGRTQYKGEKMYADMVLNSITTNNNNDEETTKKQDITFQFLRIYTSSWYWGFVPAFEKNTELGIDLRTRAGFGVGKDLIHGARNNLLFNMGATYNNERVIGEEQNQNSAEGIVAVQYKYFSLNEPEIDVSTSVTFFPSFTERGRRRLSIDLKASIDLVSDIYFSVTFYNSFDSQPPSEDASRNDWGIVTSVGYSF